MSVYHCSRRARRIGFMAAGTVVATLAFAGPAYAHVEVTASKPQALAENVVLTFVSEAESESAGFTELRVVLPEGIDPGDVTLKEAPKGWDLTPTRVGYILGGPEIPAGTDAEYKITVRRLPDATSLAFKTVETYGDGTIARWIELPTGGEEPEQPAPVLELQAAAPGAKPADTSSSASAEAASSPSAASESPAPAPSDTAPSEASEDGGVPATLPIAGAVAAVLAVGGGIWWFKRRSAADGR